MFTAPDWEEICKLITPIDNPIQVVLKFEELINSRRPEAISAFMTPDGEFIDSLGNRIQGAEKLRSAWTGYFKMVPDYSISHSEIFAHGNTVAVFGSAQGTFYPAGYSAQSEAAAAGASGGGRPDPSVAGRTEATKNKENFWKTNAAWRAVVKNDRISVWQIYADNEPIRAIMLKYK